MVGDETSLRSQQAPGQLFSVAEEFRFDQFRREISRIEKLRQPGPAIRLVDAGEVEQHSLGVPNLMCKQPHQRRADETHVLVGRYPGQRHESVDRVGCFVAIGAREERFCVPLIAMHSSNADVHRGPPLLL
jgi:hypothetical protein